MNECWDKVKEVFAAEIEKGEYTTVSLEITSAPSFLWNIYIAKYGHSGRKDNFILALEEMKRLKEKFIHPPGTETVLVEQKI